MTTMEKIAIWPARVNPSGCTWLMPGSWKPKAGTGSQLTRAATRRQRITHLF